MSSVTETYRDSRFGTAHVHILRFIGLYLVLAASFAVATMLVVGVGTTGGLNSAPGVGNWVVPAVGLALTLSWLPAAVLTVAWSWRGS